MGKMREAWIDYVMEIPEDKRDKYRAGGVYGIWIEDRLVYIGKSKYMLQRVCQHMMEIDRQVNKQANKYKVLRAARMKGLQVRFDVMLYEEDEERRGYMEGVLIRQYAPELNYQIPREEDWHGYTKNPDAQIITLEEIMADC